MSTCRHVTHDKSHTSKWEEIIRPWKQHAEKVRPWRRITDCCSGQEQWGQREKWHSCSSYHSGGTTDEGMRQEIVTQRGACAHTSACIRLQCVYTGCIVHWAKWATGNGKQMSNRGDPSHNVVLSFPHTSCFVLFWTCGWAAVPTGHPGPAPHRPPLHTHPQSQLLKCVFVCMRVSVSVSWPACYLRHNFCLNATTGSGSQSVLCQSPTQQVCVTV